MYCCGCCYIISRLKKLKASGEQVHYQVPSIINNFSLNLTMYPVSSMMTNRQSLGQCYGKHYFSGEVRLPSKTI